MIATNIEQSKHLLELGLDPASADMWWANLEWTADGGSSMMLESTGTWRLETSLYSINRDIPAWSLSALLEVMPKENPLTAYHIEIYSTKTGWNVGWFPPNDDEDVFIFYEKDLITAAYRMVVWLLENGHIKKGDNDE